MKLTRKISNMGIFIFEQSSRSCWRMKLGFWCIDLLKKSNRTARDYKLIMCVVKKKLCHTLNWKSRWFEWYYKKSHSDGQDSVVKSNAKVETLRVHLLVKFHGIEAAKLVVSKFSQLFPLAVKTDLRHTCMRCSFMYKIWWDFSWPMYTPYAFYVVPY